MGTPLLDSMALLWNFPRLPEDRPPELRDRDVFFFVVPLSELSALVDPLSEVLGLRAMMRGLSCRECRAAHAAAANDATPKGGGRACEGTEGGHFGGLHKE
ncbi:MAG: hypothetical protein AAFV77_07180 [Planctomycetota bacterium]